MNPCFHLNHIRERGVGKSYVGCLIDCRATPGVGGTPIMANTGRLHSKEGVEISLVELYERVGCV